MNTKNLKRGALAGAMFGINVSHIVFGFSFKAFVYVALNVIMLALIVGCVTEDRAYEIPMNCYRQTPRNYCSNGYQLQGRFQDFDGIEKEICCPVKEYQ